MHGLSRHALRAAIAAAVLSGALAATAASAQEATPDRVSGRVTGPGVDVAGSDEAVLGVEARQLPRTGGFALDPGLSAAAGAALVSLGFYFRSGRRARKG
jgi:hypothetical protein